MDLALCDAHRLYVSAMSWALRGEGHHVVAVVESPDALAQVLQRRRPQVCLIGIDADGIDVVREASRITRVVVLTRAGDIDVHRGALDAGAAACISKTAPVEQVLSVCEAVLAGRPVRVAAEVHPAVPSPTEGLGRFLTPREREILQALVDGEPSRNLPERFGLRPATVRTHVQNVLMKLGVHSRIAAAAYAVEHGLVEPPARRLDLGPVHDPAIS